MDYMATYILDKELVNKMENAIVGARADRGKPKIVRELQIKQEGEETPAKDLKEERI
jgi:hypothetical protein